eukprot:gene3225-6375_t
MKLSLMTSFIIFAFILSLLSFVIFHRSSETVQAKSDNFYAVKKAIAELENENHELQELLHGLESGRLSSNDPKLLKFLRSKPVLPIENNVERPTTNKHIDQISQSHQMQSPVQISEGAKIPHSTLSSAPSNVNALKPIQQQQEKLIPVKIKPKKMEHPSILVVGGTDGSGTRRVVQLLTLMGVKMVSEDPQTYDIHADIVGGWPTIVTPVIQATHSLSYEPKALPTDIYSETVDRITKLLGRATEDSSKPQSFILARGGVLRRPPGTEATAVSFGFKAPVAMTLLPFWVSVAPNLKFLHVVRDGRDIAFSANQGPVEKFYETMYGVDRPLRHPAVRGIRLWSDWNTQIFNWASTAMASLGGSKDTNRSFEYLFVHTEDLVPYSSSISVRFNVLWKIASWVGSNLDESAICCLALQKSSFMGSHDGTQSKRGQDSLKGRYGKWKEQVRVNPNLGDQLELAGGVGLKTFKYEAKEGLVQGQGLSDSPSLQSETSSSGFVCSETSYCPTPSPSTNSVKLKVADATCVVHEGVDYRGGGSDLETISGTPPISPEQCCNACMKNKKCKHYTMNKDTGICFLKTGKGTVVSDESTAGLTSADIIR